MLLFNLNIYDLGKDHLYDVGEYFLYLHKAFLEMILGYKI